MPDGSGRCTKLKQHACMPCRTNKYLSSRGTSRMQVQSPGSNNGIRPWPMGHLETGHYRGMGIQVTTYTYKCYTKPGTSLCISRSPRFPSLVMIFARRQKIARPIGSTVSRSLPRNGHGHFRQSTKGVFLQSRIYSKCYQQHYKLFWDIVGLAK